MKKNIQKIAFLCFVIMICAGSVVGYALYAESFSGTGNLSVAVPRIRLESVDNYNDASDFEYLNSTVTHITTMGKGKYFNQFKVLNYDENEQVTEVDLSYKLSIKQNFEKSPIVVKLYKIESDGSENEIALSENLETESDFVFEANQKQEHLFKVEIEYNQAGEALDNINIFVNLEAEQIMLNN